jgi:V8-like Glu-specific endopeptidase
MSNIRPLLASTTLLAATGLILPAWADEVDLPPPLASVEAPLMQTSGWLEAPAGSAEPVVVFETIVHVPGAAWLRLAFAPDATALAGDPAASNAAQLRITSLADHAVHHLNAETLEQWQHTSAYMNGDAVRVELLAAAGTGPSRITLLSATAGQPLTDAGVSNRSICETTDNRELSSDPRQGRLMTVGCTAWLINDVNSTFITAGHCTVSATSVVQFNVPLSTTSGTLVNPPPEDQYAVDMVSNQGNGGGTGNDWRYFACFANSNTGLTAYQRQQARYILAAAAPATDTRPIRITGYGTVSTPVSQAWRQVQKTHMGPYTSLTGTLIRYHVDTTGGNSGSPVLDENANLAIGIHTHAGCNTSATSSNQGTAIQHAALQAALAAPRGLCVSGRGRPMGWLYASGDQNNNIGTLNYLSGNFARIADVAGLMQGLAFDPDTEGPHGGPGVLWGVSNSGLLNRIDATTGRTSGTPVQLTGVTGVVNGLAYDPNSETLYGIMQANGQLVHIDRVSGLLTAIGAPAGGAIGGIDFDAAEGALYGIDDMAGGSRLVQIDTGDGTRTVVGPLGAGAIDCNGLAWSAADGFLYTVNASNEQLLRITKATGAATVVGPTGGFFGASFGLAAAGERLVLCRADVNRDGTTSIQDLFDYLTAWFSRDQAAEFDGTPGVRENDAWVFLAEWFAGCGA